MNPMRVQGALAWVGLACFVTACNFVLGEITVSDAGPSDASDAATDGPELPKLTCAESGSTRKALTTGGAVHASDLRVASLPGNRVRIVVPDYAPTGGNAVELIVHAYTVDGNNGSNPATDVSIKEPSAYRAYSIVRYGGPNPGFAVLLEHPDVNNDRFLYVVRLGDNDAAWTEVQLAKSPSPGSGGSQNATFAVLDAQNDRYFVAYSNNVLNTQTVYAGPVNGPADALPPVKTFPTSGANQDAYGFQEPCIAIQPGKLAYVLMNPNGASGPPPLGAPVQVLVPGGQSFQLTPPGNLNYFPAAFSSAMATDKANLAMLVADLTTSTGGYYVGQLEYAALTPSYDPRSLPETAPAPDGGAVPLKALFVGSSIQHWEVAGTSGEQLLMVGPTTDPLLQQTYPGINFAWWDGATGTSRVYDTGDANLLGDVNDIAAADATFVNLTGSLASVALAYIQDQQPPTGGGGINAGPGDVWLSGLGCQP
mgnify:CR=1 FL=1